MNAAGTLGFTPDPGAPVPWDAFGAFVTNPLSSRARKPAADPALIRFAGGYLLHSGLPNPGLPAAIRRYARRWAGARLPVVVHLLAGQPEETGEMVMALEGLENVAAAELSLPPGAGEQFVLRTLQACQGELPLVVSIPPGEALALGAVAWRGGAAAVSLAAPRGALPGGAGKLTTGRLGGAATFPQALLAVQQVAQAGIAVIGAGGVDSRERAGQMLACGAQAVQIDTSLWRGDF